jgi:hypothetical protein
MARSSLIRAADADRDAVADRLRQAAVEGRLEPDELEERLHSALRARTYGDLDRLVSDLPSRTRPQPPRSRGMAALVLAVTVRVVVLLLVLGALLAAVAISAAWWLIGVLVWLSLRSRRSCAAWHRPPRRVY